MNLKRTKILVTAVFLLTAVTSLKGNSTIIRRIGLEQGLPNATLVDIAEDKQGFLWFATKLGICRFDGNRFVSYHTGNSALSGNELNALLIDPKKPHLWIATERDGLNVFNFEKRTFQTFRHNPKNQFSLSSDEITALASDNDGGIWIAHYSAGVDYFHPRQNKFIHFNAHTTKGIPDDHIWSLCKDRRGFLYIGHLKAGLTVLSLKNKTAKNFQHIPGDLSSIPDNEVICLFTDPKENIWIGTRNGLALFNPTTGHFRSFHSIEGDESSLLTNQIYDISYKAENELWITCRMGGVSILDLNQDVHNPNLKIRFKNIPAGEKDSQLSSIHVYPVMTDSHGNTWIGFEGDGLNCLPHESSPFEIWQNTPFRENRQRLRGRIPLSLCLQSGRDIWIGEDGAGADFFSNGIRHSEKANVINQTLGHTIVQSLLKDSKGNLWFGTFLRGLACYNPSTEVLRTLNPDPSLPLHIRCIYEDRHGTLWIGTHHGIYLYHPDTQTFSKPQAVNSAIRDNILRSIIGDKAGNLYIATFGKGLTQLSPSGKRTGYQDISKGFPSDAVNTLYYDLHGELWAGTRKGLVHFNLRNGKVDLDHYTVYDERHGLANACIRSIEEDLYGNLWISTNNGISRFHPKNKKFYNYSWQDGLPRGEFQDGASACDEAGGLYFASREGVVYFDPSVFYKKHAPVKIVITEVLLHGRQNELQEQSIPLPHQGKEIRLPHDKNTLSITFSVLDYALANRIEFAYQLEGLEKEWYNCKEQSVTFRNLSPGDYRFRLRYRFKGEEWMELSEALPIRILSPWWLTLWAKMSYLFLLTGIAIVFFRIYNRRQQLENSLLIEKERHRKDQEIHKERLVFFTNVAHELRTPLTLIIGPLEDLMREHSLLQAWRMRISMIYRNASRLRELTNQILEFRKTETQNRKLRVQLADCTPTVREVTLHFAESNKNDQVQIGCEIHTEETTLWYDKEVVSIILNNLLSNAIKYTSRGEITLSVREEIKDHIPYLTFTVSDTGKGIPPEELPLIFNRYYQVQGTHQNSGTGIGLALVRNLTDLHKAFISAESQPHEGSRFCLWLPKKQDYPEALHMPPPVIAHKESDTETTDSEKKERATLLLVEDHEEIREYIREILHEEYEILTAPDGKEGTEKAFAHIPDLIISDILMPVTNGIELCKILKNDIRTSHIPLILLTAKDSTEDQSTGYEAGADSYLTKPLHSSLLKSRISNLLHSRMKLAESWEKRPFISPSKQKKLNKLDYDFLQNLTTIIEEHIESNEIEISFIAEKIHLSHSTLYRKTKALTGLSINSFILRVRMHKAAELLATGQFTVLEVMYHIGINTPAYFRKCFKEAFGCLPSEYKSLPSEE